MTIATSTITINDDDTVTVSAPGWTGPTPTSASLPLLLSNFDQGIAGLRAQLSASSITLNLMDFFVESQLPDGSPPIVIPSGITPIQRDVNTSMIQWRRGDYYPVSDGYSQLNTGLLSADHSWAMDLMSFGGGPYNPANGDGGDTYIFSKPDASGYQNVRISDTEDGGTQPGSSQLYNLQHFCGLGQTINGIAGTGWFIGDNRAPTGKWASIVAQLNEGPDTPPPPFFNASYTRWRLENLSVMFTVFGTQQTISVPCLISEHYEGSDIASALGMEQFVFANKWGRILWAGYGKGTAVDPKRIPQLPWPSPPERPDWALTDVRLSTNIVRGGFPANGFIWPPVGYKPT